MGSNANQVPVCMSLTVCNTNKVTMNSYSTAPVKALGTRPSDHFDHIECYRVIKIKTARYYSLPETSLLALCKDGLRLVCTFVALIPRVFVVTTQDWAALRTFTILSSAAATPSHLLSCILLIKPS